MKRSRRKEIKRQLSEEEINELLREAEDDHRLRRLGFLKNLYQGDTREEAGKRVGISRFTRAGGFTRGMTVVGLRPRFGGGRPPKLTPAQFAELCEILEEGQPWTPQQIHALIEDCYGVTYHPAHLSRKLRAAGMNYAKPRPMDPRRPENAEEILAERLGEALGEETGEDEGDDPVVLGFFR